MVRVGLRVWISDKFVVSCGLHQVVYEKPHDGNELTTAAELSGMRFPTAMFRGINHHLHPHSEDQF